MKPRRLGLLQMEEDVGPITCPILFGGGEVLWGWESNPDRSLSLTPDIVCKVNRLDFREERGPKKHWESQRL